MKKGKRIFPWSEGELQRRTALAVQSYWRARGTQSKKQEESGARDAGRRSEVTGGQHLNAFSELLQELIILAGFSEHEIHLKSGVELPKFYRPLKKWDIVVVRDDRLCAAIEMKSQVGPSFGNNFNNRSEEAIGSSVDFWTAFREGAMGMHQPWLGYFLLVEETRKSTTPVKLAKSVFEPLKVFNNTSYLQRYGILCQRLVLERNYSAAALLAAPAGNDGVYSESVEALRLIAFLKSLYGHLAGIQ